MPDDARLGEALRELAARGFRPSGQRGGERKFVGSLECRGVAITVELRLSDWEFLSYPSIKVLDGMDRGRLAPHINPSGWLCYLEEGSVVLDRYAPATALAQCLEQARGVLEAIRFDPAYRTRDIQDEFLSHWLSGASVRIDHVLMGTIEPGAKSTHYWLLDCSIGLRAMLADDAEEAGALALALGGKPPKETVCPCWLFRSDVPPAVPERMPSTVKELFKWLQDWDPALHRALQRVLGTEKSYLRFKHASFAVHTRAGWLGFGFELHPVHSLGAQNSPKLYRQHLHGKGGARGLIRLAIDEVGPAFVHSRNLTFADLRGKQVHVVGCGAIGSHVAEGLVRLGAGSGGGRLTLVDPEQLGPENLGRHALGYPSLFRSKVSALCEELTRAFPLARIEAVDKGAEEVGNLFRTDLVVDASGEEALSELLNARRLLGKTKTPMLHAWIVGNGEGVQALWAEGRTHACYRCCLRLDRPDGTRQERFPLLHSAPTRRTIGCRAFTPYAVAAPMAAAALALEMVGDWLQRGDPSPRFRTRLSARADARKVKSQDVDRLSGCPACGERHAA